VRLQDAATIDASTLLWILSSKSARSARYYKIEIAADTDGQLACCTAIWFEPQTFTSDKLLFDSIHQYRFQLCSLKYWIIDLVAKGVPTEADWPYNDNWGQRYVSPGPP